MAIFKRLDSVKVQDKNSLVVKEHRGVLAMGSRRWSNNFWLVGAGKGCSKLWMLAPDGYFGSKSGGK